MNRIKDLFSLDLRALALMRVALGLILIFDLSIRFSDLIAFYSDDGVFPREAVIMLMNQKHFLSLHFISGEPYIISALFVIAYWCAFHVLIGKQARIYVALSWLLLLSIQNRNTLIGQAGDDVLRLALMWGMFLPLQEYYSWDCRKKEKTSNTNYFSWATVGLTMLIFSLYFFSGCMKTSPEWTSDYTAVYYALGLDQIALPAGKWLYNYPAALKAITAIVYYVEFLGPFLLFIFWKKNFFRLVFFILFVCFHLGLSATLFIGFFPAIVVAVLIGFLPSNALDLINRKIEKKLFKREALEVNENVEFSKNPKWKGVVSSSLLALLCLHQLLWNCKSVGWVSSSTIPLQSIAWNLRLDQSWGMFAPGVFKEDGWFVFEGITKDKAIIDISRDGQKVRYGKPQNISSMFKNDRWRKYTENLLMKRNHELRLYYAAYLYRKWMERHPEMPIEGLRLVYMKEMTLPDYKFSEPKREVLLEWHPQL